MVVAGFEGGCVPPYLCRWETVPLDEEAESHTWAVHLYRLYPFVQWFGDVRVCWGGKTKVFLCV